MENNIKNIAIIGLGGIGGYIGGTLARDNKNIFFMARGKRLEHIRSNGITIKSKVQGNFVSYPKKISDNAVELGKMDLIIIAVKSYSLQQIFKQIDPMISKDTIILPLLNGINLSKKIKTFLKEGKVLDGLIYIMSAADKNFSINQQTPFSRIIFNSPDKEILEKELNEIKEIFVKSNIEAIIADDIIAETWKKYIFNCAYNTLTAAHNISNSDLCNSNDLLEDFKILLQETYEVSQALKVNLPKSIIQKHYNLTLSLPASGTSSLKRDIENNQKSEFSIFSNELINLADQYKIKIPLMRKYDQIIKNKIK